GWGEIETDRVVFFRPGDEERVAVLGDQVHTRRKEDTRQVEIPGDIGRDDVDGPHHRLHRYRDVGALQELGWPGAGTHHYDIRSPFAGIGQSDTCHPTPLGNQ